MSRAAHTPLRSQVVHQLFFQYSPRLNEQATVDGFVRHSHALVIGIVRLQPSGNLFGRPVQDQFTRNDLPQLPVHGKKTLLRSQGRLPGLAIRLMSAIGRTATMAGDLPAHRRGRSIEVSGYPTNRRTGSDPSREVLSLSKGEGSTRASAGCWRNPSARQQQTANGAMWLAEGAPDLMQRLPGLPSAPDISSLRERKSRPFPLAHKHHP